MVMCQASAAAKPAAPAAPAPPPAPTGPFPRLEWAVEERVPDALKVFAAPADAAVALVTSPQGLWRTKDCAATWELIPRTGADVLGTIGHIAFCPAWPDRLAAASLDKGVMLSEDGGKTWSPAGGVSAGLADKAVEFVTFAEEDRSWRTLLACHGEAHAGLSRSIDGGKTWRVLAPRRFFRYLVEEDAAIAGASAPLDEPDTWSIAFSQNFGEDWRVVARGLEGQVGCVTATRREYEAFRAPIVPAWRPDVLWAMRKGPLLLSQDLGEAYIEVGPAGASRWASVFTTPGAQADDQWLWAYDPYRVGVVCARTTAPRGPWQPNSHGLPVTSMTLRGANAAANSEGLRFYACVNKSLYVATPAGNEEGPRIALATASPPVLMFPPHSADAGYVQFKAALAKAEAGGVDPAAAAGLKAPPGPAKKPVEVPPLRTLELRVVVTHPRGPGAITSVRVEPDILALAPVALFDDGAHNDGTAGDGVWGATLPFRTVPNYRGTKDDTRRALPGIRPIAVRAVDNEGKVASWTMMLGVFYEAGPYLYWDCTYGWGSRSVVSEGKAAIALVKDPAGKNVHVQIKGEQGPWTMCWANAAGHHDVTALAYVCFELTASPGAGDVAFCLVDGLDRPSIAIEGPLEPNVASRGVPLLAGKYLPAMDGKTHIVRVPIAELTRDIRFMRTCLAGFGLKADKDGGAGTYDIGHVWFEN
jgi:hypothetical protein